jgi:hypothetical protein
MSPSSLRSVLKVSRLEGNSRDVPVSAMQKHQPRCEAENGIFQEAASRKQLRLILDVNRSGLPGRGKADEKPSGVRDNQLGELARNRVSLPSQSPYNAEEKIRRSVIRNEQEDRADHSRPSIQQRDESPAGLKTWSGLDRPETTRGIAVPADRQHRRLVLKRASNSPS